MHKARSVSENHNADVTQLVGAINDESLKEKLETCKHFLVDCEMENGGQKVLSLAMKNMDAHILSQRLDTVFEKFKCAAKLNVAFGFVLKNVEDWTCSFYNAHENNTSIERSKFVATKKDLVKIKNALSDTDMIEPCTKTNKQIQNGYFRNSQKSPFLLLYL